jgi:threonylcarbamoyladenosine tRNA methylthiotransferase MtaB
LEKILEDKWVRVALETLGCKLNQAETEYLGHRLVQAGCKIVSPDAGADIYILNTCTVTHIADRKSRHLLRMARKKNPEARIVAIGCYAERASKELSELDGVSLVIGNKDKTNLIQILEQAGFLHPSMSLAASQSDTGRTRSFIKIQDGCNNFCAYCIVPFVRGRENSLSPNQVVQEIKLRASEGYKEVVLTGTEIGKYSYADLDLKGLVERVLNETEVPRIRLSSLQPQEISLDLLKLWLNPRLCSHLHLSLQSGSDSVLFRMNRRYNSKDYRNAVELIRAQVENVAVTTDIIVGFPGETEKEFQESYDYCQNIEFSRMHVFSYSIRQNTSAASMAEQIEAPLKKKRSDRMLALADSSLLNFQRRFVGDKQMVLFEQSYKGLCSGLTANYIKVYTKSTQDLTDQLHFVKFIQPYKDGVWVELV